MKTLNSFLALFIFCTLFAIQNASAQTLEKSDPVFISVEQMPEFPGGEEALMNYIAKNIKYTVSAREKNIEGSVYVFFIVDKSGEVTKVRLLKGFNKECDEEAVRVVKSLPKFKPGMQNGEPVNVQYTLPIRFKLSDPEPEPKKNSASPKN